MVNVKFGIQNKNRNNYFLSLDSNMKPSAPVVDVYAHLPSVLNNITKPKRTQS